MSGVEGEGQLEAGSPILLLLWGMCWAPAHVSSSCINTVLLLPPIYLCKVGASLAAELEDPQAALEHVLGPSSGLCPHALPHAMTQFHPCLTFTFANSWLQTDSGLPRSTCWAPLLKLLAPSLLLCITQMQ